MDVTTSCPQTEELRQLIDGSLSGERQQDCTQHLDVCTGCQNKLEELATEGSNLSEVVAKLHEAEPARTSAYWPALTAVVGEFQSATTLPGLAALQTPGTSVLPSAGLAALPASGQSSLPTPPQTQRPTPRATPRPGARVQGVPLDFLQPAEDSAYLGRLAHFDVMRVLGRGGMGIVLEAFDSRLQRHVALKVLNPEMASDELARQRFCREARSAASITHENVVAVHQVEKSGEGGLPYLVMQLVAGESLEQRLTRVNKLPLREVIRIGMQASHGLAAAHAQGLIHRDIKPGNILLEPPHDTVKLTDFGLARVAEDVKLTRTGFVTGTPLYMAPEQALGGEPDPRSDLFSLGVVLYELGSGQPPFTGNSALAILKQIADTKHRPLSEVAPEIPTWFSETIDDLLAKKPADRIQTAAHLAELFDFQWALLKTSSEDLPTVCIIEELKRKRRNRLIAVAVGAIFLAIGLLGGWFLANRNEPAVPPVAGATAKQSSAEPVAVLSANAGPVWSVAFDKDSKTVVMAVEDGSVRLWDLPTKSIISTFSAHRGNVWSVRFSPNGQMMATAGDDGLLKLWKLPQAEPFKTLKHSNAVRTLAFAHDDQALFTADREGALRMWLLADQPAVAAKVEAQAPGAVYAMALSPNDETLATAGSDKVVQLWNAKNLTTKLSLEGHAGQVYGLTFHRDGRRLASVGWDKTVRIWDTGSGLLIKSWAGHDGDIWSVAYSPDGTKLATGGTDGAVKLWDAETGALLATYLGHKVAVHTVAFNREGNLLASGGRDGAVRIWKMK